VEKSPHSPFFVRLVKKPHFFTRVIPLVRAFRRQAEGPGVLPKAFLWKNPLIHLFCAACEEAAFFSTRVIPLVRAVKGRGVLPKAFPWKNPLIHLFFVRLVKKPHFFYQSDTAG
jgi:hypothetical protein